MSLPFLRLSPDLPENGAIWCERTAIWIMLQPTYVNLPHGHFMLVQITRNSPAEFHNEWLIVRARFMRVPNCGDCPHARLYARTTQPDDDCIPHEIELRADLPGEETWTVYWKKKGKKMLPASEELPSTSNKDPPERFNLPVARKSDDDDDDFHVQNTPMANPHESSDEEVVPKSPPRVDPVIPPVQPTSLNIKDQVPNVAPAPLTSTSTPSTSKVSSAKSDPPSSLPRQNPRIADMAQCLLAACPNDIKTPSPPKEKTKEPSVVLLPEFKKEAPTPRKNKPDDSNKKSSPVAEKTSAEALQSEAPVASSNIASQDLPTRNKTRLSNSRINDLRENLSGEVRKQLHQFPRRKNLLLNRCAKKPLSGSKQI